MDMPDTRSLAHIVKLLRLSPDPIQTDERYWFATEIEKHLTLAQPAADKGEATISECVSGVVKEAARLASRAELVSEYQEDWNVKVPASVLHQIKKQNERMGSMAQRLKTISDKLRPLTEKPDNAMVKRMTALKRKLPPMPNILSEHFQRDADFYNEVWQFNAAIDQCLAILKGERGE